MKYVKLDVILLGVALIILGCDKTEEPQGLDLDTTYFPFGLGYEWCYEEHHVSVEYGYDSTDFTDTVTISILDSFWDNDTLVFELNGWFRDLNRPVKIWEDSIVISTWRPPEVTVSVVKPETFHAGNGCFDIEYHGDTLCVNHGEIPEANEGEWWEEYTRRIKSIGVISQGTWGDGPYGYTWRKDRLLYFYNGEDTVYKAY